MSKYQTLGIAWHGEQARIYLQTFTTGPADGLPAETNFLTPGEYTADIFDAHADRLIENIVRLKTEARTLLSRKKAG
jgi:hypothetical protein